MRYYMKSKFFKLKEDFWIKNDQKEKVYFVDNKFLTMGLQFDISKGNEILYYVKEKLLTFMSKYEIFEQDKVIAKVKQKVTIFREKIEVESKYGNLEIVGSIFDYNYRIYQNKKEIAHVAKEIFSFTDNYYIDINFEDEAFILCLVVIVDNIIDKNNSAS
ncbi:LURP-one-related/scramblase family protein [Romboutsia lituseburensis]|uniref:Uncharacterized protein YxjI n=1 Tax=Romboutsia lituseburensis DSM 797 TaxID=1121325 RepID=A0A1G9IJK9_9FIRM|nr:LURP-one-related family protein [Romboutsia lituseburensis]SDL25401.1 Uncharacterized protein YxjI [Romboutsia lituseburensis DSM 797]